MYDILVTLKDSFGARLSNMLFGKETLNRQRYQAQDVLLDTLASTPFSSLVEDTGMDLRSDLSCGDECLVRSMLQLRRRSLW